ncbi:MAG TPA: peroxiredoxin [Sphingomonas sp.]|nr:peroxiredoxin [Sphingomonas sp.]
MDGGTRRRDVTEGDTIPDLTLIGTDGPIRLADFRGKPFVLYFYPKDDTPGCTREAQDFSALADAFAASGVALLGVSKDSPAKHAKFTAKHGLSVPLASDDEDGTVLQAFGAWIEKSLYGKTYMGIDRSTFLFDADGRLARAWRKVKVPGHAEAVLAAAKAL